MTASFIAATAIAATPTLEVRKVAGINPQKDAVSIASGSGIVVGKHFVLTNRHVVLDDNGKVCDGFRIRTGPDYKASFDARAVFVCDSYDLALIQTVKELSFDRITVLDSLAPLSASVTAYGFPLGSQFGVGLTSTGGQISRHPVEASADDSKDKRAVKLALWHDAVLSHGSSGGPLFSSKGTLVGLNFAYIVESNHALAVPSNVISAFLRKSNLIGQVDYLASLDNESKGSDPKSVTVFVEAMGAEDAGSKTARIAAGSVREQVLSRIKSTLPTLSPRELFDLEKGELKIAFPETKATDVKSGEIARITGTMDIIQILEKEVLIQIDGVKFFLAIKEGAGAELGAKVGDRPIPNVPVDGLFFVGKAGAYKTVVGRESFAFALVSIKELANDDNIKELVAAEKKRREEIDEQKKRQEIKLAEASRDKELAAAEKRYLEKVGHTFNDASGKHSVDAAAVRYDGKIVELVRLNDKRKISIPLDKLSLEDQKWLEASEVSIKFYGPRIERLYSTSRASISKPAK